MASPLELYKVPYTYPQYREILGRLARNLVKLENLDSNTLTFMCYYPNYFSPYQEWPTYDDSVREACEKILAERILLDQL